MKNKVLELIDVCMDAVGAGRDTVTITVPHCWKRPKGFPRGELLCENDVGKTYAMPAGRLLDFLLGLEQPGDAPALHGQAEGEAEV